MEKCVCSEGWEGDACECPKSNQTCVDSKGVSGTSYWRLFMLLCHITCQLMSDCVFVGNRVFATAKGNVCAAAVSVQSLLLT